MGKRPRKKWNQLTAEEKAAAKVEAAARNKKRLENYDPLTAARNALRREFSRSPIVIEMMNFENKRYVPAYKKDGTRAKKDAVEHLCVKCSQWKRSSKKSKVAIDHIDPVVDPVVGFVDLQVYYERMWVGREKLQKLCGDCHQEKTNAEWHIRRYPVELAQLEAIERGELVGTLAGNYLRRYTPKRLAQHPYPTDFVERIRVEKAKRCR